MRFVRFVRSDHTACYLSFSSISGASRRAQTYALSRVFNRLEVALELSQEDEESLKALRRLQELFLGGVNNGDLERGGKDRSSSPFPQGIPLPIPAAIPSLLPRGAGTGAMGPREAVDAARQAAGLATMIGPGMVAIVQNFFVQLTVRSVLYHLYHLYHPCIVLF